ncbi:hypothetical protein GGI42DRAFT_204154 [Trichoderma sp. SZMC 28013]
MDHNSLVLNTVMFSFTLVYLMQLFAYVLPEPQTKNLPHQIPSKRFMPPHTNKFGIPDGLSSKAASTTPQSCEHANIEERRTRELGEHCWNS